LYYQLAAIAQEVSLFIPVLSQAIVLDQANQLEQEEMILKLMLDVLVKDST
jgi:hypothetical protein